MSALQVGTPPCTLFVTNSVDLAAIPSVAAGPQILVEWVLAVFFLPRPSPLSRTSRDRRTATRRWAGFTILVLGLVLVGLLAASLRQSTAEETEPRVLDLAVPVTTNAPGEDLFVRLQIQPMRRGENTFTVLVTRADRSPLPGPAPLVRLRFVSLQQDAATETIDTQPNGAGGYTATGTQLSLDGWWRIEAIIQRAGQPDAVAPFYLLLPDPNLDGIDAVPIPTSSPEAVAVYERGRTAFTSLHRMRSRELMSDGMGNGLISEHAVSDGTDGRPPSRYVTTARSSLIQIGEREWIRVGDQPWIERASQPINPPSEWDHEWADATDFQLGRVEEVGGEPSQIVTFYVPAAPRLAAAWYAFWVGEETGHLHRTAMISRSHYMVDDYSGFDAPLLIEPPIMDGPRGTPAASEIATPA